MAPRLGHAGTFWATGGRGGFPLSAGVPRQPPAGRPATLRRCAQAPVTRPANNSLALPRPPDITCGQRGKGGGPTACIAVGLVRWLSASRRPAGAPAAVSARAVRSLAVAGPPL